MKEIVIKISESLYEECKRMGDMNDELFEAIRKGTVLEPHGKLIDANELKKEYPQDEDWEYPVNTNRYVVESIDNADTILEATGGEDGHGD